MILVNRPRGGRGGSRAWWTENEAEMKDTCQEIALNLKVKIEVAVEVEVVEIEPVSNGSEGHSREWTEQQNNDRRIRWSVG